MVITTTIKQKLSCGKYYKIVPEKSTAGTARNPWTPGTPKGFMSIDSTV